MAPFVLFLAWMPTIVLLAWIGSFFTRDQQDWFIVFIGCLFILPIIIGGLRSNRED